ncbi:NADP-dependent malic enzyme [Hallerella succinigenes]|uniref:Allosteric NADP-dependent malic enzyme n=1 Tax=Hallerella succinigenes TaxID=1896222 RepID=A0A2M9A752_9BACT|nr:NADP-dependent malic enzyme [Hallerella succinigenes]PJJ41551.1 allosteric NADP-dependent malic enzyme [Hallerella succinigenes]
MSNLKEQALAYHANGKPGKIEVIPTKPHSTQTDLGLAYTPGVAEPCREIEKDNNKAYDYTAKGNLVAVISNGTAVLGLGDIGAVAGKPVMEGKGLLFKIYAGVDVFDIEVNEKDPKKFCDIVKGIAPTFGGINLEDIKAPECFEIEETLKKELNIPVMHDDQHGTAIISSAALINALDVAGKKIDEIHAVVNGAGAAAIACTNLYVSLGIKRENIVMLDSKGVIRKDREKLTPQKAVYATDRDIHTLEEAMKGADLFLGLSKPNILTKEMLQSMAKNPIVFALANPVPEVSYDVAISSREDIIFATGRSDYPNQVNNVIGFPYIFRGALDVRATEINEHMKHAAVRAIAELARKPVPEVVNIAYNSERFSYGRNYLIPKPLDPRLLTDVSIAVAKAAVESGVAHKPITDWNAYYDKLRDMMGYDNKLMRGFTDMAKSAPKRLVFTDGENIKSIKAAVQTLTEGVAKPILLGNAEVIKDLFEQESLSMDGITIINPRSAEENDRRHKFAQIYCEENGRKGVTLPQAYDEMFRRDRFGMMLLKTGAADAVLVGNHSNMADSIETAKKVIGIRKDYNHFGALHIVSTKKGVYFLADTLVNSDANADTLVDIAKLTHDAVKFFAFDPVMAMLSYSNFGSDPKTTGCAETVRQAVKKLHEQYPEFVVDGEMQVNLAIDDKHRDRKYPFTKLFGKTVNTLIFPSLSAASTTCHMLLEMGVTENIGPVQMGLNKPVHFVEGDSSIHDIFKLAVIAVVDAIAQEKKEQSANAH